MDQFEWRRQHLETSRKSWMVNKIFFDQAEIRAQMSDKQEEKKKK